MNTINTLFTQNWYVIENSNKLKKGDVLSKQWMGSRITIYRGYDGRVQVIQASCPHLGADLGHGKVIGNSIQCGFHHLCFDNKGECSNQKSKADSFEIPKLFIFPSEEKFGVIWAYYGSEALFPIPDFPDKETKKIHVKALKTKKINCHPHVVSSNGFDIQHFKSVHKVNFEKEPVLSILDQYKMELTMHIIIPGEDIFLRFLRLIGLKKIKVTFSTLGGNIASSHTKVGNIEIFILFANRPIMGDQTENQPFLMIPKTKGFIKGLIKNHLYMIFLKPIIEKILRDDALILENMKFRENFTPADLVISKYFDLIKKLPTFEMADHRTFTL